MLVALGFLLILWLVLIGIGIMVKGLVWLAVFAGVFWIITAVWIITRAR